jgi:hypothetical protein
MGALDYLKSFNDFLEQVPVNASNFFKATFKAGEEYTQTYVDTVCRWMAWKININVERLRQKTIKMLSEQYGAALGVVQALNVVKNAAMNPLDAAGSAFSFFSKPIAAATSFVKTLMTEIPRLAANLANIANSLPPAPPNPDINFNAFKLKINTISMADLSGASMPTPEEMFPEPAKPFGKEAFNSSFENAKSAAADEGVVYKLPKKSEKKISGGSESDGTAIA